jgi:hypothetical protein
MKRDLDLIRSILLQIESNTDTNDNLSLSPEALGLSEFNNEIIKSHLKLMHEANLIELYSQSKSGLINCITWKGY